MRKTIWALIRANWHCITHGFWAHRVMEKTDPNGRLTRVDCTCGRNFLHEGLKARMGRRANA